MGGRMTCPHGMPSRTSCFECFEDGPVSDPPRWEPVGRAFTAVYPGTCPGCDAEIAPERSRVMRYDRSDGTRTVYVHADLGCRPR